MKSKYIQTKIRPIKKMFIIEPNDFASFSKLFVDIQREIDSIYNLIFINDVGLWSSNTLDFVKRSDPDIILNFSDLQHNQLSLHFGINSVDPTTENHKIGRYCTDLFSFSRRPPYFNKFKIDNKKPFEVLAGKTLADTDLSVFMGLNFGIFPAGLKQNLSFTIFENIKPKYLTGLDYTLQNLFRHPDKFVNLSREIGAFGGSGYGSSIYYADYNEENFFDDKKIYFFVSARDDFKAISHFWNTRSYYCYANITWIPTDFLEKIEELVTPETVFVCFEDSTENKIKQVFNLNRVIKPTELYFKGPVNRWAFFEHEQTVTILDEEVNIHHPSEKGFGLASSVGAFVLDIKGLEETIYPKRRNLGRLFVDAEYHELTPERFTRMSETGIAKYQLDFSFTKDVDTVVSITLPSFEKVINHLFKDIGFDIRKTTKTSIFEQTINLLGGIENIGLLSRKSIFNLIVTMTPKVRTEKIVSQIIKETPGGLTNDNILEIIAEIKENGAVSFPSVTLTIDEMLNKCKPEKPGSILPTIQNLHNHQFFLRGKFFECVHCNSKLWLQISEINRKNYCTECNNLINIPVFKNDKAELDHFRLNQLIVRAVDQGQLSTLLPLNLFLQQRFRAFQHLANIEICKDNKLYTDIDLLIKIGKKVGLIECKTLQPFHQKQVEEFVKLALSFKSDFIAFSSLHLKDSMELRELFSFLNTLKLTIPAFIITSSALFDPKERMIQPYFEFRHRNNLQVGPIFI